MSKKIFVVAFEFETLFSKLLSTLQINPKFSGSLRLGVTMSPPTSLSESDFSAGMVGLGKDTVWIEGSVVKRNDEKLSGKVIRNNFCFSLDRLRTGDRIGMKFVSVDGSVKFFINGDDFGSVATNFTGKVFPVVELYGSTVAVSSVSSCHQFFGHARSQESLFPGEDGNEANNRIVRNLANDAAGENGVFVFHENHGRNVQVGLVALKSPSVI